MLDTGASSSAAATSPQPEFNCKICVVTFPTKEVHRQHMKDEWHVYNLKRRIATLPPISLSVFEKRVLPLDSGDSSGNQESPDFERDCEVCNRHFTHHKTWRGHLKSRNHAQKLAEQGSKETISNEEVPPVEAASSKGKQVQLNDEDEEEDDKEIFNSNQCLFCPLTSPTIPKNISHMSQTHNFFIPDIEYLIDIESFLSYLFTIISVFNECIFCATVRNGTLAVQDHMRGKGHCKLDFEDEEQGLEDFYGFDGDEDEDAVEGEDAERAEKKTTKILVPDEDDELKLPSGKILGHRSKIRYFRQRLPIHPATSSASQPLLDTQAEPETTTPEPESTSTQTNTNANTITTLSLRAGTSTSLIGLTPHQQTSLAITEKKIMKMEMRAKSFYEARVERGGNRQKRFKVP